MNEKFARLHDELTFTRELLGIGLTSIKKANFSNKGVYLQAFSNLSLGLERLMKLCLILNFYRLNQEFPEEKETRQYGHNLMNLLEKVSEINNVLNLDDIHYKIISHLTEFALGSGTRYSNINFVVKNDPKDPIFNWSEKIDKFIWNNCIPNKRKCQLRNKSREIERFFEVPTIVCFEDDDRRSIDSLPDYIFRSVITDEIAGYRVLFLCQIIEYILDILKDINSSLSRNNYLPEISRIFSVITYGTNSEKRKRRDFIRL